MPTTQKESTNPETKSDKKIKALKLYNTGKYTKSDVAKKVGQPVPTVWGWIEQKNKEVINLSTPQKISLWQGESLKYSHVAGLARDKIREQLEINPESISVSEKRAIAYSLSIVAGIQWDKSRLEAGAATSIIDTIHTLSVLQNEEGITDVTPDSNV